MTRVLGPSKQKMTRNVFQGAYCAWGCRKIVPTYSGSCMEVRRSSDNSTQDIGFSGDDLDESSLTSFVGSNDGFVTKLYDQGSLGYDATQATTSRQPQIVTSGTVEKQNSKPSMVFDATPETMLATTSSTDLFFRADNPVVHCGVYKHTISATGVAFDSVDPGDYRQFHAFTDTVDQYYLLVNPGTGNQTSTTTFDTGNNVFRAFAACGGIRGDTTVAYTSDGYSGSVANSLPNITALAVRITLGSTDHVSHLDGYLSEVIVTTLSQVKSVQAAMRNMEAYYGL